MLSVKNTSINSKSFEIFFKALPYPTYAWQKINDDIILIDYNESARIYTSDKIKKCVGMTASDFFKEREDLLIDLENCFETKENLSKQIIFSLGDIQTEKWLNVNFVYTPPDLVFMHTIDRIESIKNEGKVSPTVFNNIDYIEDEYNQLKYKESIEKYKHLFETSPFSIWLLNEEGKIIDCNVTTNKMFTQLRREDIIGKKPKELIEFFEIFKKSEKIKFRFLPKNVLPSLIHSFRLLKRGKTAPDLEFSIKRADKSIMWALLHSSQIDLKGEKLFQFIIQDITERIEVEEKFKKLINNIQDVIVEMNQNSVFTYLNPKVKDIFGYDPDELIGKRVIDLVHPEDLNKVNEIIRENITKKEALSIDVRGKKKDGNYVYISAKGISVREEGEIKIIGVLRDVSKRKIFEEKLKTSEQKYRVITENANDLIAIINSKYNIEFVNKNPCFNLLGYNYEEIKGKNIIEFVHPDDQLKGLKALKRSSETGWGIVEIRVKHKKGHYFWFEVTGRTFLDEVGNQKGILIGRNFTERRIMENKLRQSEANYRLITENSNDLIRVLNKQLKIEYINENVHKKILGYSKEDLIGKRVFQILNPGEDLTNFIKKVKKHKQVRREVKKKHKNGKWFYFDSFSKIFYDEEGELKILTISRDISEKKKIEDRLRESEKKYRLITENSHDLIAIFDHKVKFELINENTHKKLLGFNKEELIGRSLGKFLHPKEIRGILKFVRQNFKKGGGSKELRFKKKDGTYLWLDVKGAVYKVNQGEYKGVTISRDITEKKIAEDQIRESEKKYRMITETSNDLISIFNDKMEYEYINESPHKALLGYNKEELLGLSISKIVHKKDIRKTLKSVRKERDKDQRRVELRLKRKDGKYIIVDNKGVIFKDEGQHLKAITFSRDITAQKQAEIKLKESEEKYRNLFENAPIYISLANMKGTLIDVNSEAERIFGYKPIEMINKNFVKLGNYSKDQVKEIAKKAYKALKNKEIKPSEFQIKRRDGSLGWINHRLSVIRLEDAFFIITIVQDITERKIAEEKLRMSKQKLQDKIKELNLLYRISKIFETSEITIDQALVMIIELIPEAFRYPESANGRILYKNQEFESKNFTNTENKLSIRTEINMEMIKLEMYYKKDISFVNEEIELLIEVGNRIRNFIENLIYEQKIKESEEKYRLITQNANDMILIINRKEQIEFINEKLVSVILGYEKDKLIGKSFFNFIHPKDIKLAEKYLTTLKNIGEGLLTIRIKDTYGIYHWFEITGKEFLDFDNKMKNLLISRDVTKRKESEELIRKSEKLYRKAYNQAEFFKDIFIHDMNNILSVIKSSIDLSAIYLNDVNKIDEVKEIYEIIKDQFIKSKKLIENVRKISKLDETDGVKLKKVDLLTPLKHSLSFIGNSFKTRKIETQLNCTYDYLYLKANDFLSDIFDNILMNSVKYNEKDQIQIKININKLKKMSRNYIKIEFIDNGIGIPDDRKQFIFQKGFSGKKGSKGMGVGLTLVKKIIDNYNGEIWVEDRISGNYSQGSKFVVLIPEAGQD